MKRALSAVALVFGVLSSGALAEDGQPYRTLINPDFAIGQNRVTEVVSVEIRSITIENDGRVVVVAKGLVPTSGWTSPQLDPWVYIAPPADGIYDFDFTARPPAPGAIVLQVISTLEASFVILDVPEGFAGVRVHGKNNAVEAAVR